MTGKIYTGEDLWELIKSEEEKLGKQVYIAEPNMVINVEYPYEIPLAECDTPERILGWSAHLCGKTWMTTEALERFIYLACGHHGLKLTMP